MILNSKSIKSHNVWLRKKKRKKEKQINILKSHIIHSGTNKAIDSLGEIKRHHSHSSGYNALLNGVQYMAQLGKLNISGKVI